MSQICTIYDGCLALVKIIMQGLTKPTMKLTLLGWKTWWSTTAAWSVHSVRLSGQSCWTLCLSQRYSSLDFCMITALNWTGMTEVEKMRIIVLDQIWCASDIYHMSFNNRLTFNVSKYCYALLNEDYVLISIDFFVQRLISKC